MKLDCISKLESNVLASDFIIESKLKTETGLKVDSVIKLHKMVTVPKSIIKRKLGELDPKDSKIIQQKIVQLFELNI